MRKGFTLIELMIVIAIIAIIAAIAIPNLLESRITANESAAAASLKSGIFAAQAQFQSGAYSDIDGDGRGEYANSPQWLAGAVSGVAAPAVADVGKNNSPRPLTLLAPTYNVVDDTAVGAYRYSIDTDATDGANNDYAEAESFWAAYATPSNPGSDGRRAFAINLGGVVYSTKASLTDADLVIATLRFGGTKAVFATDPTLTNAAADASFATPYQK